MKVQELIQELLLLDPDMPVYKHDPVEGDSENIISFNLKRDTLHDTRYPALVFF